MHLNKRFLMLALAAMAVAAFAVPASASAHTGQCAFEGVAGNINPGVMVLGGSGQYTFQTTDAQRTQCQIDGGGMQASKIFSRGNFDNTVCGTGSAHSQQGVPAKDPEGNDSTTIDGGNNGTNEISSARYTIAFRGGQGIIDIETVNGATETLGAVNGHVSIVPAPGESCTDDGVNAFEVAGAFHAEW
jgi:hypothetical protein